jgi:hypothetical protein
MKRREFITGSVAATAFAAVSRGWTQGRNEDKKSRIALMMFGLSSIVKNNKPASPERTLDIWDIGELAADRYGLHNVELQTFDFPSTEMSWLKDFRTRLNKTKTKVVQINVMVALDMTLVERSRARQLEQLDIFRVWFERAAFFGCPRVLVNEGQLNQENKGIAISNLKEIVALAKPYNLMVVDENHGGGGQARAGGLSGLDQRGGQATQIPTPAPSAAPQPASQPSYILLTEVLKGGGAYTCVDFQNFPSEEVQHAGIRGMLPYTSGLVHAGMRFDLHKALAITRELGYKGIYSIKAGGAAGTNPLDTTQKVLDVLMAEI